ncbi:phosphatase PAP2 family protein [Bacillus aerolatus]|uniref:Phosphatase PAP2 family protein n=1 Tax=Bacillus aerolatus TaxID=2653354 RepID=A0A6I1FG81_9BACI|nr:phosphatase PAP2 family protein [Bacillus aerolatus]KAB7707184.1 phosphatase PAP2 family protein [Bacillus aerolatus]
MATNESDGKLKRASVVISLILLIGLAFTFKQPLLVRYDVKIILFFEGIRTEFLNDFFFLFTEIGSIKVLRPLAVIVSAFLLMKKRYLEIFFFLLAFLGVRGVNYLLKQAFERERPSFNSIIEAGSYSFPSGHAMNSTAFFGFLFYLFIHILKVGQKHRLVWLTVTITIVVLIAISRVYLGVHYLTDIVAGACGGLLYLFIVIYLYKLSSRHMRQEEGKGTS